MNASIIIPQRGQQRELTEPLVCQLQQHEPGAEIIVVDDGGEQHASRSEIPGARMLNNDGRGLTAAWNLGIKRASGSRIVLLNNDVHCKGPFVHRLAGIGGVTGAVMRDDPDVRSQLLEGWCLSFSTDVFRKIGDFDERMTTYFSDTDFQVRAIRIGIILASVQLPLHHVGHQTAHHRKFFPQQKTVWKNDRRAFLDKWAAWIKDGTILKG